MDVKRVVGRLVLASALTFIGASLVQPPEASAAEMLWRVRSNYKYRVQISFYSQNRRVEWPGNGKVWGLNDDDVHEFNLSCRSGEKICFGAWVTGNSTKYWGVGADNKHGCRSCCFTCGEGDPQTQILNGDDEDDNGNNEDDDNDNED